MRMTKLYVGIGMLLALGLNAETSFAEQYDPPIAIGTLACPAGSTGYGNARFIVFPAFVNANWRLTIWCNAAGAGRRFHYEPAALFAAWPGVGGASGIGWPPPLSYSNQYQLLDIDSDGDLDVFQLLEIGANTWSVFVSRAL